MVRFASLHIWRFYGPFLNALQHTNNLVKISTDDNDIVSSNECYAFLFVFSQVT
jgi:hypothetical protein